MGDSMSNSTSGESKKEKREAKKKSEERKKEESREEAGRKRRDEEKAEEKQEFRHLVRIAGLDIDGNKKVIPGLSLIKGIGQRTAQIICELNGIDINKRIGHLSDEDVEKIEKAIKELPNLAPSWVLNRRKDYETGEDKHLIGSDLVMAWREDITRLRRIRAYRGIRHELGLAVRGQRTRTWGRGKGATVGVKRKKRGGR